MVTLAGVRRYALVTFLGAAVVSICWQGRPLAAGESLLGGKVVSSAGAPLAGVPVRARRENGTITVNVFTNMRGEYAFPGWAEFSPGSYAVAIELPDFERATQTATLTAGQTRRVDFTLRSRQPTPADATAAEIVAALPGTNEQKHLVIQCDNCHSLQLALRTGRNKDQWIQIIRRMAGERAVSRVTPGTRAFGQKKYVEPLAEYLASIRGPGAAGPIPFRLRPRPSGDAAAKLVVTEYGIPRAGQRDLTILRGDRRFVWPHDILLDSKSSYAYYTDHYSFTLGRLDRRTGDVKEFPYSLAVDDKNQTVWTNDFNSGRIYRLDARTGASTEYLMPEPYEIRDLTVDENAARPTVWIPVYRPPAKVVKVEVSPN